MFVLGTLGLAEAMGLATRHLVLVREQVQGTPWTIPSHSHLVQILLAYSGAD
jgi:hypothetical protein